MQNPQTYKENMPSLTEVLLPLEPVPALGTHKRSLVCTGDNGHINQSINQAKRYSLNHQLPNVPFINLSIHQLINISSNPLTNLFFDLLINISSNPLINLSIKYFILLFCDN